MGLLGLARLAGVFSGTVAGAAIGVVVLFELPRALPLPAETGGAVTVALGAFWGRSGVRSSSAGSSTRRSSVARSAGS